MHIGLFGTEVTAEAIVHTATTIEQAGYESYWRGEHLVLPDPRVRASPLDPDVLMLDLLVSLTWAAANTTGLRLGTGILLLPQRNPVVVAKEWASLDHMSHGRLTLGVGVGYLREEYRAVGADYGVRGALLDEYLDAIGTLWYDEVPRFRGDFVHIEGVSAYPRPTQRPVPLVSGGRSTAALRRAVARGHGWYGFRIDPPELATALQEIRRIADDENRGDSLGELEISVTPPSRLTPRLVAEYQELGVHRLITLSAPGPDRLQRSIDATLRSLAAS